MPPSRFSDLMRNGSRSQGGSCANRSRDLASLRVALDNAAKLSNDGRKRRTPGPTEPGVLSCGRPLLRDHGAEVLDRLYDGAPMQVALKSHCPRLGLHVTTARVDALHLEGREAGGQLHERAVDRVDTYGAVALEVAAQVHAGRVRERGMDGLVEQVVEGLDLESLVGVHKGPCRDSSSVREVRHWRVCGGHKLITSTTTDKALISQIARGLASSMHSYGKAHLVKAHDGEKGGAPRYGHHPAWLLAPRLQ